MSRNSLDFKTLYERKILGIDPGWGAAGGTSYAIVNMDAEYFGGLKNKPILSECGLLTSFACDTRLTTKEELCNKMVAAWRTNASFSKQPYIVSIEKPVIYPGCPVRHQTLADLSELVGMLGRSFQPKLKINPTARDWKGNSPKSATQEMVLNVLDFCSKNALSNGLASIARGKQHNVFDAIGIAIYAAQVFKNEKEPPANIHKERD